MIVADGEYDNAGLQRLGSPAADADALAGVLSDRAISDFEVRAVRNETAHVVQAEHDHPTMAGQVIAAAAVVLPAAVTVVLAVRARRDQPIGRQP